MADEQITQLAPKLNLDGQPGLDERQLIKMLDKLDTEGEAVKEQWVVGTDVQRDIQLYRGQVKRKNVPEDDIYFDCNFIGAFIDRMVAQLTDNQPILRVENRKRGLSSMAKGLEKIMGAVWEESAVQRHLHKMCHNAAINGCAGIYTGFNFEDELPMLEMVTVSQVIVDPGCIEAASFDNAEYVRIRRIMPLSEIREKFKVRGSLVKANASLTSIGKKTGNNQKTLLDLLKRDGPNRDAIGRAEVDEWYINDRQTAPDGKRLFPSYRRIIRADDVILWDGPNPWWDGAIPIDWLDWMVDPEHPFGKSEPARLRRIQLSFNQLLDSLVLNQILSNFISVVGDLDAVSEETWKSLEKISSSIIIRKRNRNAALEVKPPPVFGADKLQVARSIFTYAQLLCGVTDVTMGESPGSLQSGLAIEGLVEGANLMTRARAARLEDMLQRIGQKMICRILQFVPSDRVFHLLGPSVDAITYAYARSELFINDDKQALTDDERRHSLKHLRFTVMPGSSAPGSRTARAKTMADLLRIGAASRKDVLQAADFQDPDEMIKRAEADAKVNPLFAAMAKKEG